MTNPDPSRITAAMWKLWIDRPNSAWKLSGFYADKRGYHNTVENNIKKWPGNYSIHYALDLPKINRDKARAIDLTMSDTEMVKWTQRMKTSALDPADNRLAAVREFYGTLDNENVYGLIKNSTDDDWRVSTADNTHLWHGHTSIFTIYVSNWTMLAPLLSVWSGQTLTEWTLSNMIFPKLGESGEAVAYWQQIHNAIAEDNGLTKITVDSDYGPATAAAFKSFYVKLGGKGAYAGEVMSGWMAMKYHQEFVIVNSPKVAPTETLSDERVKELVSEWLTKYVHTVGIDITGTITGKAIL